MQLNNCRQLCLSFIFFLFSLASKWLLVLLAALTKFQLIYLFYEVTLHLSFASPLVDPRDNKNSTLRKVVFFCNCSMLIPLLQNRRSALSLAWNEWFSQKGKEWKIYDCRLALSTEPQIWKFRVVFWPTTSKHCIKKRAARAARLLFLIQPIKLLTCDVVVAVAVIIS